jgi:hypothetical protein
MKSAFSAFCIRFVQQSKSPVFSRLSVSRGVFRGWLALIPRLPVLARGGMRHLPELNSESDKGAWFGPLENSASHFNSIHHISSPLSISA